MCYMMEGAWLSVDEYDSSNLSFADSDVIDSETEAELYSIIHYEGNLHDSKCHTNSEVPDQPLDKVNVSLAEKNREYLMTESVCNITPVIQDDADSSIKMVKFTHETVFLNKLAPKLNQAQREKSSIDNKVSDISYIENSEDAGINQTFINSSLNNKRKRKIDQGSSKSSSLKKIHSDSNDSSDSDSIIWTEVDGTGRREFQTNLYDDEGIINLSSESESQFSCQSLPKKSERNIKNLSMPNIKIGEKIKDLWFINDQDLYRPKKNNSRRYHDNVGSTCTNCFGKGHNSRICPMPRNIKCFICGGGHLGSLCVNRICGKCFRTGHDSRRCWMPFLSYCTLCNMKGHIKENCPDIWRRYHLTTRLGKIVRGKRIMRRTFPYCWNCGHNGHIGAICKESRGPKHYFPTWPCVVSYEDPADLLRKRLNGYCDRHGSVKREAHLNQRNIANDSGNFNAEKKKKKKKNKLNQQCNKIKKALREKDFPRTPKDNNNSNLIDNDDVPESLNQLLIKRLKRKEKNRKRRLKRRLEFLGRFKAGENNIKTET